MSPPHTMTLRELIDEAQRKRGTTSVQKLATIARDAGFKTNHTTIAAIRANTYPAKPSPETLEALAYLAGVSDEVAYAAGGIQIVGGKPFAKQLPRDVDVLTPTQREAVLGVIRAMIKAQKELRNVTAIANSDNSENNGPIAFLTDEDLAHSDQSQLRGSS